MLQICPPSPFVPTLFLNSYLDSLREALCVVLLFSSVSELWEDVTLPADVIRLGWTDGLLRQTKQAALIFIPTNDFTAAAMVLINLNLLNGDDIPSTRMTHSTLFCTSVFQVHYKLSSLNSMFDIIMTTTK